MLISIRFQFGLHSLDIFDQVFGDLIDFQRSVGIPAKVALKGYGERLQ
jgi:hypothetical protein